MHRHNTRQSSRGGLSNRDVGESGTDRSLISEPAQVLSEEDYQISGADNLDSLPRESQGGEQRIASPSPQRSGKLIEEGDLHTLMSQCLLDFFWSNKVCLPAHRHNSESSKDPVNSIRVVPVGEREAEMVDDNFGLGGVQFLGGAQSHGGLNGVGREDGVRGLGRQSGVTKPSHNYGAANGTSHWRSHIPKQLYFSGEEVIQGEWKSYTFQLEMYIENMDLGPQDCKRLLFYTLRGRALNYAVSMEESNPGISFRDLIRQMKVRFGAEIRCETAYLRLQNAVQERGETLYEWADRLCDLARKAVTPGQGSSHVLNVMVVMRFCLGCRDRKVGIKVYEQGPPETLGDAIRKVEWLQHIDEASKSGLAYPNRDNYSRDKEWYERREANPNAYQVAYGYQKRADEAFGKMAEDAEWERSKNNYEENTNQVSVQAVGNGVVAHQAWEQRLGRLENLLTSSVEKITSKVEQVVHEMEEMKKEIKELRTATAANKAGIEELRRGRTLVRNFSRGSSASRSRSVSPRGCFKCGEIGHYKLECPQLEKRVKFKESQPLNEAGLDQRS